MGIEGVSRRVAGARLVRYHSVDGNTVGLWQLNGDYLDSGPNALHLDTNGAQAFIAAGAAGLTSALACQMDDVNFGDRSVHDAPLAITGAMSVMALMRMDLDAVGEQTVIMFAESSELEADNVLWRLNLTAAQKIEYLAEQGGGSNIIANGADTVTKGVYHHIAWTRDGSGNINFYIDGVPDSGGTKATAVPTGGGNSKLTVGRNRDLSSDNVDGSIVSLKVVNVELTPGQIATEAEIVADWVN